MKRVGFIISSGSEGPGARVLSLTRRWDLLRRGEKRHPAGSDGEKVLSSDPTIARPRLPALIPLAPEPHHGVEGEEGKPIKI